MPSRYNAPGRYVIRIAGYLDTRWSERLGGLTVHEGPADPETGAPTVELSGDLADQAALYGALNLLYDYRFPLLYVEYLGPAAETSE